MLKHAVLPIPLLLFLFIVLASTTRAPAAVVEQLIAVIDGEPCTLTNLTNFAKSKIGRVFPSGDLNRINDADRDVLEQFLTDKLIESETREAGIRMTDSDVDQYI